MAGAVIENLSNRKLFVILAILLVCQFGFFIIGAWYSPIPTSSMEFELTKCHDPSRGSSGEWFHMRPMKCEMLETEDENHQPTSFDLREIVFVAQMPHKRDGVELEYSPWFQFLLGIIHVDVKYSEHFKYENHAPLMLEVRLGGRRSKEDAAWSELSTTNVSRTLECHYDHVKNVYDCEIMDLFEMGSIDYSFYLLNIRVPIDATACQFNPKSPNCQIGLIDTIRVIEIHQNGGFTSIWLWLKTLLTPVIIGGLAWYWNRVNRLARKPMLLEKAILALGISMLVLDFPFEWLSLVARTPFLLLLSDVRQGVFYCVLFAFWLIFAGEHLIDDTTRNNIASYRFNLTFIVVASALLLLYDLLERGSQIIDPFHSIWSSHFGSSLAYLFIYLASLCTVIYFVFLFYKMVNVWRTIKRKRAAQLYKTCENRRLKVESIIYRFKFLMLFTLVCAALTITSYVMKQYGEAQLHSDDPTDGVLSQYTSAFFTGTFGMWNIYVLLLLSMYAPSHKQYAGAAALIDESEELMDDNGGGTESNAMTTFLKSATD